MYVEPQIRYLNTSNNVGVDGVLCAEPRACSRIPPPLGGDRAALIDAEGETTLASEDLAIDLGQRRFTLTASDATSYRCRAGPIDLAANRGGVGPEAVAIRVRGARATVSWMLVLQTP